MQQQLINNLKSLVPFTDDELTFFLSHFEFRQIRKNDCVSRAGEFCNYVTFINKGLFRYYVVMNDKEHIGRFFIENEWTGDYAALLTKTPCTATIEALEDAEIFTLSY